MTRYLAYDVFSLTSRTMTPEGFLVAPGTLARTGVQLYRAHELGLDESGMDPMRIVRLHRPAEEVFAPASMASFENKPITLGHPEGGVSAANWEKLAKGEVCDISRSGELMAATLHVKSAEAIAQVQSGKVELSSGYTFLLDMTPGTTADGQPYDGVQREIRGNHVAIVDAARCGSACRIGDAKPNEGDRPMALQKVVVDGIPFEAEATLAGAIEKLIKDRDVAVQARDEALGKLNAGVKFGTVEVKLSDLPGVQKVLADAAAEIERLKKDVMTPEARDAMVQDWAKMVADAKRLVPDLVTDKKTCVEIRREVITTVSGKDARAKAVAEAVLAGKTVQAADADTLRAVFNAVVAAVPADDTNRHTTTGNDKSISDALLGDGKTPPPAASASSYHERNQQAWQGQQKQ